MRAELLQRDQKRGLGPEGPILPLLKAAVIEATALVRSSAQIEVETDAQGRIVRVSVLRAASGRADWRRIAQQVKLALGLKRLRIPAGTQGVRIRLAVAVRPQLPSGADTGLALRLFGQELQAGDGPRSSEVDVGLLSGTFDLANLGAVAQRVAHTHVLSVATLE